MTILIILGIVLQIFAYNEIAWCSTLKERATPNINNNTFHQDGFYQQEMKLYTHDHIHHTLNFHPDTTNKLRAHAYNYLSPFSSTYKSKIQLQNDSINMFHAFHTQHNKYKKNLSFMQLGIHNLLSEQIFNFGGGKRYLTNKKYAIGYNAFYHCPISNKIHQPYSMNVGIEYWFYNTLFMLNNYYNLDNIFDPETSLQKFNTYYPKRGHQLYIQTKFPHFFEFTGKIKLEQFIYNKKYKKIFNKKNNDYYLSLDLNYQPIPILGFSINNIFLNKQYNSTICKILIDYQFGIPIMEQINYMHKKNTSIQNNIDTIIQPFIPTIIQCQYHHDDISMNDHHHIPPLRYTHKIIGHPGEIKIIQIEDNNDKFARWDFESLSNLGGNIVAITNNTYALYLPKYPIKQEDNIFISYINDNVTQVPHKQTKQNIRIVVKDFSQQTLLNINTQNNDASVVKINNDSGVNVTESITEHTFICHDDNQRNVMNNANVAAPQNNIVCNTPSENDQNTIKKSDDCTFLTPPPPPPMIPFSFLEKDSSACIAASSTLNDILPLSRPMSPNEGQQTYSGNNTNYNKETRNPSYYPEDSKIVELNQNDDLSYRLFTHRQSKFASIGTTEHMNKLENTIRERRNTKHLSDMEQMFAKLNLAQSSSSISEDCATDDSSDSFKL
ncbi:inverse autotransporter beta domain-containing protein [Blochmannia endosymbiont of Camponotus sp. C-046]|uniref:inverse autotransporter beta domain-containing protein n=1 Tax=Blochmannia endosymbiont of Camponotus sp. C-046 TaxID=2945589 RepID=UPI002025A9F2|nr:inverse autotransporter beta domain-containing protein [Blochmannia endosymbiont of Camponotus sp. C-046]URJ28915.1 inverse autotransporter beta domain-containing protein [Blochmannia endosymbiont of Camponotus sp. C-046]